jgi:Ca2+-binding EF-hand superfamily protein
MDDEKLAELREIFSHFDKDKSDSIEANELLRLLRALGDEPTADDLAMALEALDTDHNGRISFEEFTSWWANEDRR